MAPLSAPRPTAAHKLLTYPVANLQQGRKLASSLQSTLARLTSPDATVAALVTAQAVTITAAFHHNPEPAELQTLLPALTAMLGAAMVNDLVCHHLDRVRPRFAFLRR
jgi:hypothetical protein